MAICSVIRKQKLRKENMSPDFSCAGLIAGRALGPLTPWTGVGFNEKGQGGKRERARRSGLFRVSKDTYAAANCVKRNEGLLDVADLSIFISNWYTETGRGMKERRFGK